MRKIKETFLLCCAAAILCSMMPEHCFAITIGGHFKAKVTITNQELKMQLIKSYGLRNISDKEINDYIKTHNINVEKIVIEMAETNFKKTGFKAISAKQILSRTPMLFAGPILKGTTWEVTGKLPGVNVSSDDGNCNITTSPNCDFSFPVAPGLRTLTFSKDGFFAEPWQQNVQQDIPDITATLSPASSDRGIRGQLTGVSPSTANCIEVTLTLEGNPCLPVVRSTNACLSNAYHFSFENLDTNGTYKIEVTDSNCTTSSSCTGIVIPNNNQNCVINGVSCPQD
jgi:hypothetical protein